MRHFVDLHLKPSTIEQAIMMLNAAKEMGFKQIAFTEIYNIDKVTGISLASRKDIEVTKQRDKLDLLKKARKNYDIIAVKCLTKEVARQTAKDDRVDIILFPEDLSLRKNIWLDVHQAELMKETGCAYEVNISDLLDTGTYKLSKLLSQIRRELNNASRYDLPILLSSGATTPIMMREPKALSALAILLDIDEKYALDMISTIPARILNQNLNQKQRREKYAG